MPVRPIYDAARCIAAALFVCGVPPAAMAQEEIYAPCLNTSGDTALIDAGFVAGGWTRVTDPADRTAALWTIGEMSYVVRFVPPTPASADALSSDMSAAREDAVRSHRLDAVFQRDGVVALYWFPFSPDQRTVQCIFAGPNLPESAVAIGTEVKTIGDLSFQTLQRSNPSADIASLTVETMQYAPPFKIDPPITGLMAVFAQARSAAEP